MDPGLHRDRLAMRCYAQKAKPSPVPVPAGVR
jgi:hypothetical protein